ncbi:MAG: porin, partial [Rhizobiales bacterium]|nr:porin [Hyphomicrobiales bacterium]
MKMVKSLLLVSAAGFVVAATGAQAADLPVKAKPVEYVKVCSLYGAGFYYVPGTDICMKVGSYIRFQQDSTLAPSTAPNVYMTRGFIQLAGFTFGKAVSFFDFADT